MFLGPLARAAAVASAARALLAGRTRRRILCPLDQLLWSDESTVLVLGDELEPDPAALLVDFLDEHVQHVSSIHDVLDVGDTTGTDIRDVKQAVRALLQL